MVNCTRVGSLSLPFPDADVRGSPAVSAVGEFVLCSCKTSRETL